MLFYDIAITSADEVEIIWMQPKWTHMTLLWALVSPTFLGHILIALSLTTYHAQNRYLSPLGFIVVILCEPFVLRRYIWLKVIPQHSICTGQPKCATAMFYSLKG